jgi:hypothetical protein
MIGDKIFRVSLAMRPIAVGKFRKAETVPLLGAFQVVTPSRLEEPSRDSVWDAELARHAIAVRRWRGVSHLPIKRARS